MSALHAAYLAEIIEAHREGLRILRELAAAETDPAERRRLAIALVRARPIKDPDPDENAPAHTPPTHKRTQAPPAPPDRTRAPEPLANHAPANTPAEKHTPLNTEPSLIDPLNPISPLPPPPPGFKDCTHPALPPYPGMHIKQLLKRARSAG